MADKKKYYQILQLNGSATKKDIKKAYRELAKKWHPDKYANDREYSKTAQQKFILITEAYEKLISDDNYDDDVLLTDIKVNTNNNAQTFYNSGIYAYENDEWKEAINYFSQAIKIDDCFAEAYFYRGTILEKQDYLLRAESDFNKFKELRQEKLEQIWQSVIDNLTDITSKGICQQGLKLISLHKDVAHLTVPNHNQLSLVESKISDFQQAFNTVCNAQITIQVELNVTNNKSRKKFNHSHQNLNRRKVDNHKDKQLNIILSFILVVLGFSFLFALTNNLNSTMNENNTIQQQ